MSRRMAIKRKYEDKRIAAPTQAIIQQSDRILREYALAGYSITLRGLYYQFIARDLFPESWIDREYNRKNGLDPETKNTVKNYKRLGCLITDGRMAGLLDWEVLVDQGRSSSVISGWDDPAQIIESSADNFYINKWEDQPYHIEVMVEKDALSGILEPVCDRLQVGFSANKGYSSSSHLYRVGQRMKEKIFDQGKNCVVIYLGDHDPSGIDMTRDIDDRIRLFASANWGEQPTEYALKVERIALNMPQISLYNPPPNPAKETDSRYAKYAAEHGEDSWELDALDPALLDSLVEDKVLEYRDEFLWEQAEEKEQGMKNEIQEFIEAWRNR